MKLKCACGNKEYVELLDTTKDSKKVQTFKTITLTKSTLLACKHCDASIMIRKDY